MDSIHTLVKSGTSQNPSFEEKACCTSFYNSSGVVELAVLSSSIPATLQSTQATTPKQDFKRDELELQACALATKASRGLIWRCTSRVYNTLSIAPLS